MGVDSPDGMQKVVETSAVGRQMSPAYYFIAEQTVPAATTWAESRVIPDDTFNWALQMVTTYLNWSGNYLFQVSVNGIMYFARPGSRYIVHSFERTHVMMLNNNDILRVHVYNPDTVEHYAAIIGILYKWK